MTALVSGGLHTALELVATREERTCPPEFSDYDNDNNNNNNKKNNSKNNDNHNDSGDDNNNHNSVNGNDNENENGADINNNNNLPTGVHLTAGPREGGAGGAGQGGRALHPEDLDQQGLLHQLHLLGQAGRRLS